MAIREIIEIDESRCNGCGACETGCPEGALRIIEGKARLVGESLCDGLGACIGNCPEGAIKVTRREAKPYSEAEVVEGIAKLGPKVIEAHLEHLLHHGQEGYAREALAWLAERGIEAPTGAAAALAGGPASRPDSRGAPEKGAAAPRAAAQAAEAPGGCSGGGGGCPGSASRRFTAGSMRADAARALVRPAAGAAQGGPARAASGAAASEAAAGTGGARRAGGPSALSHWPIQLHLVNPRAPQYAAAELLVAADCTAFALGSFHAELLAGKSLVIACPKLDQGREIYVEKLAALIDAAASVSVAVMEVPCCSGLVKLLMEARERSDKKPAIEVSVVGIEGGIIRSAVY